MSDVLEDLRSALAGRYHVEDVVGSGGMATVYLAEDLRHHRKVAVKVLDPELAALLGDERFLREVQVTATLRHPHILPLLDSGEAGGLLYYVMPFVEGPTLRERIERERQLPVEEAVRLAREVADALAYAHSRGLVHRDVKPENILLEAGHAVVTDFGIVRAASEAGADRLTASGVVVGTPVYSSPEQLAGDRELDGRSDIHGLGCVLYEMLAGEPPHAGPTFATILARKAAGSPMSIRNLRPSVPPTLERTLARALAALPADRQQTADELAWELSVALEGEGLRTGAATVGAADSDETGRTGRGGARRVRRALYGAGALALSAFGLWWGLGRGRAANDPLANRVVVLPYQNETGDPSLDPVGRMVADWITDGLARTPGVMVVPTSVVLEALSMAGGGEGGAHASPRLVEVAGLTRSGIAVTGSYYLREDDLEFHSELVDVGSGTPFATVAPIRGSARAFEGAIDSVRIQVMGALATRLSELIGWEIPPSARPPTYEAFRSYSEGMEEWARGDYTSASESFARAYADDTTYVRSLLLATAAAGNAGNRRRRDSLFAVVQARRDELTPYDRYRLDWLLASRRGDRTASLAAARAGTELVPYGTLHSALVLTLVDANRPREALENAEAIIGNNAMSSRWYAVPVNHAQILHILGEHERELAVVRGAYDRIDSPPHFLMASEARALAALGREEELGGLIRDMAGMPVQIPIAAGEVLVGVAREARAHGLDGVSDAALERALRWLREQPAVFRESSRGTELMGSILYEMERWDEAAGVVGTLVADSTRSDIIGRTGALAARRGDRAAALSASATLAGLGPGGGANTVSRARIAALLGEREEAVGLLRRAFAEGSPYGLWLHVDPDLAPLRDYPPYRELVRPRG